MVNRWLTREPRAADWARRGAVMTSQNWLPKVTKRVESWHGINSLRYISWIATEARNPWTTNSSLTCTNSLPSHHRRLAKEAVLDVVQHYHSDLAQRLADEAALIFRRTAIAQRLREGEQRKKDELE